jgi:hypothetical protein
MGYERYEARLLRTNTAHQAIAVDPSNQLFAYSLQDSVPLTEVPTPSLVPAQRKIRNIYFSQKVKQYSWVIRIFDQVSSSSST